MDSCYDDDHVRSCDTTCYHTVKVSEAVLLGHYKPYCIMAVPSTRMNLHDNDTVNIVNNHVLDKEYLIHIQELMVAY